MINMKCDSEKEVNSKKLAVLKNSIPEKVALAKKYNCIEKIGVLENWKVEALKK